MLIVFACCFLESIFEMNFNSLGGLRINYFFGKYLKVCKWYSQVSFSREFSYEKFRSLTIEFVESKQCAKFTSTSFFIEKIWQNV